MNKLSGFFALGLLFILSSAFVFNNDIEAPQEESVAKLVKWYSWEEAVEANKTAPKKFFVDIYTDWCGWCKKMDANTFETEKVAAYLNENFYPVKFNAEQKETINFAGQDFEFVQSGRRGVHMLAYSLTDGKMSYPTTVTLNEKMERIMISPGYKDVDKIMKELTFASEEIYKNKSWGQYNTSR